MPDIIRSPPARPRDQQRAKKMSRRRQQTRDRLLQDRAAALKASADPAVRPLPPPSPRLQSPSDQGLTIEQAAYRIRVQIFELSRSVGNALAAKELEQSTDVGALASSAARVSVYADQMIATVTDRYKPALDCREGCSYCCRKPGVLASVPELLRILHHIDSNFDPIARAALVQRAQAYALQMQGRDVNAPTKETVPCPLLVNERCSVYKVRPLVCRGYNSTSVEACRTAHDTGKGLVPIFALNKDVSDGATVGLEQQVTVLGWNDAMLDLGRSLNIALSASISDIEDATQTSGSLFAPAENKTWADELLTAVTKRAREFGIDSQTAPPPPAGSHPQ